MASQRRAIAPRDSRRAEQRTLRQGLAPFILSTAAGFAALTNAHPGVTRA
jgi:hypothetical protein